MMYLVTVEDSEGMWFDDPTGWDNLADARRHLAALQVKGANAFVIYECHQIELREASSVPTHRDEPSSAQTGVVP